MIKLDTSKVYDYIEKGFDHKDWYTKEYSKLLNALPEFEGLPIIRTFAVTSMTTSIEANVHLALKALLLMKRGLPFIGFLPNQITYLNLISKGEDVPGRKIMNFIKALEGDVNSVVVDIWMCRAFGVNNARKLKDKSKHTERNYWKAPSKKEYDTIEQECFWWSTVCNVEPRQIQSMIWAGIKRQHGMTKNVSWSDILINKKGMFAYEI
jgi:hypothetical protein